MKRNLGIPALAATIVLASLAGFSIDTVTGPAPLEAQQCGNHTGKLCDENCLKECTNGSCCGWSYTYYPKVIEPT